MVFAAIKYAEDTDGKFKIVMGTYTNSGVTTGGAITTGLSRTEHIEITPMDSAVQLKPVVVGTPPYTDPITITTAASSNGIWKAKGKM